MSKNKKAFVLVSCLLIICLIFLIFKPSYKGTRAEVSVDNKVVMTIDLEDKSERTVSLEEFGPHILLLVKDGKVRFLSSSCPNQICVNTGFIDKVGDVAICLPNKTSVTVLGK